MNVLDDLFGTAEEQSKEAQQFLAFLKEREPRGCFSLFSNNGGESIAKDEITVPGEQLELLAHNATKDNRLVSLQSEMNTLVYAFPVSEFDAVVLFTLSENGTNSNEQYKDPGIVPIYVELFFARKALRCTTRTINEVAATAMPANWPNSGLWILSPVTAKKMYPRCAEIRSGRIVCFC